MFTSQLLILVFLLQFSSPRWGTMLCDDVAYWPCKGLFLQQSHRARGAAPQHHTPHHTTYPKDLLASKRSSLILPYNPSLWGYILLERGFKSISDRNRTDFCHGTNFWWFFTKSTEKSSHNRYFDKNQWHSLDFHKNHSRGIVFKWKTILWPL